jgi:hypothetical protein
LICDQVDCGNELREVAVAMELSGCVPQELRRKVVKTSSCAAGNFSNKRVFLVSSTPESMPMLQGWIDLTTPYANSK